LLINVFLSSVHVPGRDNPNQGVLGAQGESNMELPTITGLAQGVISAFFLAMCNIVIRKTIEMPKTWPKAI
jgi:hypothetical protein